MAKKQLKSAKGGALEGVIREEADRLLKAIAFHSAMLNRFQIAAQAAIERVSAQYSAQMEPHKILFASAEKGLQQVMKHEKATLFDGTDVVRLANGSLIRNVADKVSIPRDALAACEWMGFIEVVKISKNLDREAVEKWPDERLLLIGAERKQKEEFSYDLKKEGTS
jgi:phage host-nuclease inhibitor protein Gam